MAAGRFTTWSDVDSRLFLERLVASVEPQSWKVQSTQSLGGTSYSRLHFPAFDLQPDLSPSLLATTSYPTLSSTREREVSVHERSSRATSLPPI